MPKMWATGWAVAQQLHSISTPTSDLCLLSCTSRSVRKTCLIFLLYDRFLIGSNASSCRASTSVTLRLACCPWPNQCIMPSWSTLPPNRLLCLYHHAGRPGSLPSTSSPSVLLMWFLRGQSLQRDGMQLTRWLHYLYDPGIFKVRWGPLVKSLLS